MGEDGPKGDMGEKVCKLFDFFPSLSMSWNPLRETVDKSGHGQETLLSVNVRHLSGGLRRPPEAAEVM